LLLRNERKYELNGATGIFLYSFTEKYFLLCLKNPLSANYDVGQNVQSVKIAVGQNCRRSKLPSVKNSVGQNCRRSIIPSVKMAVGQNGRRSKLPSVKMAVGQSCVGQKTWNHCGQERKHPTEQTAR
jgi:hypothetical protein